MKLLIICGSLRKESFNYKLAKFCQKSAIKIGFESTILDPQMLNLPILNQDETDQNHFPSDVLKAREMVSAFDALIFVTPEYNASIPGGLKNLIDWLSRAPADAEKKNIFALKPIAIMSASVSPFGGLRALLHLRQILSILQAIVIPQEKALPLAHEVFKTDEGINSHHLSIEKVLDALYLMAKKLA